MGIDEATFARIHGAEFQDEVFLDASLAARGTAPDFGVWNEYERWFPPGPILEIGPGSGHLLAAIAAHREQVFAIETSATHRSYIEKTWGISAIYEDLSELPPQVRFAGVVMINTVEHVYDVHALFERLRRILAPGGVVALSAPNAGAAITRVVGTMWSMYKTPDHVSFPSKDGLARLAERSGLRVRACWTGELPHESIAGLAVAARDFLAERRPVAARAGEHDARPRLSEGARSRRLSLRALPDPIGPLLSRAGLAGSIKAVLAKP
ncbi:MAG: class I SAM-dependent methyltransferase [Deltaproteobacteria bacterium]|nr:class I SAM-dependent methyltransferase [Deltaproteobacteria bacterium]